MLPEVEAGVLFEYRIFYTADLNAGFRRPGAFWSCRRTRIHPPGVSHVTEHLVRRAVLFHQENDMFDRSGHACKAGNRIPGGTARVVS